MLVYWKPPEEHYLKLNIDGASRGNAGCGGIIRDTKNHILAAYSEFLRCETNNFAEMKALLEGLMICYQMGVTKIEVETDSNLLVQWFLTNLLFLRHNQDYGGKLFA